MYVSLCGAGETTMTPNLMDIVLELLKEGHFVNVTTNGTYSKFFNQFEEYAAKYSDLMKRLNFSFSLHHLEMQRTKLYDAFWKNVDKVRGGELRSLYKSTCAMSTNPTWRRSRLIA